MPIARASGSQALWIWRWRPSSGHRRDPAGLRGREERVYFVVETKGRAFLEDLRNSERAKIDRGEAHFKALHTETDSARYKLARTPPERRAASTGATVGTLLCQFGPVVSTRYRLKS